MPGSPPSFRRRVAAEAVATALLLATVVGSGIMAQRLAAGNVALALLANTLATGAGLVALIAGFGPISGAHLNPVVTLAAAWRRALPWREVPGYLLAQLAGAPAGVLLAHAMFEAPAFSAGTQLRRGSGQLISEVVASFGLVFVIGSCARRRPALVPAAVGCYIAAAYWFTASTSFANPAVTLARALTDSFAGIHPADVPPFIAAQLLGASLATAFEGWLSREAA